MASAAAPSASTITVDEDFIRARVGFDLALKSAQGNHSSLTTLSFKGVEIMRAPEWLPQMTAAVGANTYCTELDLSQTGLTDLALQQLAATFAVPLSARAYRARAEKARADSTQDSGAALRMC